MAKTLIKQTFNGDITVVEGTKRLTGVQVIDHWQVSDEDGDTHVKQIKRVADAAELALLLGSEVATLTSANATLNEQNASLQAEKSDALTRLANAVAALRAVAAADASWDNTPRSQVASVLEAEV